MDRLSAAMLSTICLLLCISAAVVCRTWIWQEKDMVSAASITEIEEEMELASIAMNDQAQVINGGGRDMWVRVKIQNPEEYQDIAENRENWALISDTIKNNPDSRQEKAGVWVPDPDGYYYYSIPIPPGELSHPLFQSVCAAEGTENHEVESVKAQAEGVQVNWTITPAEDAKEAFDAFCMYQPLAHYKGNFV